MTFMQDSDRLWTAAPPARHAVRAMLQGYNASFTMGWQIVRDAPLANAHAGPTCTGSEVISLSAEARHQLAEVLRVDTQDKTSCL